ncbi:MAG TPA: mechanosensitive ion channel family protein [Sunxiuqinia sp.]|nr:mechanosensitive ion channel family protein [Sunxiuqinia sp.]
MNTFIAMLPNFVVAVSVVLFFYFVARAVVAILGKTLFRLSQNVAINKLIASLTHMAIMTAGVFIALGILELDKTVTSLLAGVGIIGLAVGFAFKDTIANFLSGIYITVKSTVNVGDIIEFGDHYGAVKSIGLRAVKLKTFQGQEVVIPNRLVFEDVYKHYTIYKERRIDLHVGVSYGEDLQRVEDLTLQAIKRIDYLQKNKPIDLYYEEFGDSSINFVVRYWVDFNGQTNYLRALSDGIKNIKATYDRHDITIPFPIRTLDFGIKGGKTLSEMKVDINQNSYK